MDEISENASNSQKIKSQTLLWNARVQDAWKGFAHIKPMDFRKRQTSINSRELIGEVSSDVGLRE